MIEFGRLTEMIENIEALDEDQVLFRAFSDNFIQEEIIELNTTEQLYNKGVDSKGVKLGKYSPTTVTIKARKGQRFDHVTLKDTGEFYESWVVRPYLGGIWIDADPIKDFATNLFDDWGVDVLGLTDESLNVLVPDLKAEVIEITLHEILR